MTKIGCCGRPADEVTGEMDPGMHWLPPGIPITHCDYCGMHHAYGDQGSARCLNGHPGEPGPTGFAALENEIK